MRHWFWEGVDREQGSGKTGTKTHNVAIRGGYVSKYVALCSSQKPFLAALFPLIPVTSLGGRHHRFYYPILQMRNVRHGECRSSLKII